MVGLGATTIGWKVNSSSHCGAAQARTGVRDHALFDCCISIFREGQSDQEKGNGVSEPARKVGCQI